MQLFMYSTIIDLVVVLHFLHNFSIYIVVYNFYDLFGGWMAKDLKCHKSWVVRL